MARKFETEQHKQNVDAKQILNQMTFYLKIDK